MIIFDTDISSIFAKIDRLKLLLSISPKIYITPMIKEELYVPLQNGYNFPVEVFKVSEIIFPVIGDMKLFDELRQTLGRGESEAIAIAKSRDIVFITNDKQAIQAAKSIGVTVFSLQSLMKVFYIQKTLSKEEIFQFFEELKIKDNFKMPVDYLNPIFDEE